MKRLQVSIVINLISLLFVAQVWAQTPIARVDSLAGNAFGVNGKQTSTLKVGDYLYKGSQVISEEGTSIVITDFLNHKIIISGSTDIEIFNNEYKLNRGYVWIQSTNIEPTTFKTANSIVTFTSGDSILSFDSATERTQLMTINGSFNLANLIEPMYSTDVRDGMFSFIDNEYEEGAPRQPTNIGETSYVKLISLFKGVGTPEKRVLPETNSGRAIASVNDSGKGKIIYRKSVSRAPSSVDVKVKKSTGVPITIFKGPGILKTPTSQTNQKATGARAPASIAEIKPAVKSDVVINKDFESSLIDAYKKQRRHDGEVLRLIEELDTYDQDYKQDY